MVSERIGERLIQKDHKSAGEKYKILTQILENSIIR